MIKEKLELCGTVLSNVIEGIISESSTNNPKTGARQSTSSKRHCAVRHGSGAGVK